MTDTAAAEGGNNSNEYVKTENESNANEDEDQTLKRVGRKKRAADGLQRPHFTILWRWPSK